MQLKLERSKLANFGGHWYGVTVVLNGIMCGQHPLRSILVYDRDGSVLSPFLFAVYLDNLGKLSSPLHGCYVILYADDILLVSLSITPPK